MATDHHRMRSADSPGPQHQPQSRPSDRPRQPVLALGRPPRLIACALAVAVVPLALHFPTPGSANSFAPRGDTGSPMALPSLLPRTPPTAPPEPGATPSATSTVPEPAGAPPPLPGPGGQSTPTASASASASASANTPRTTTDPSPTHSPSPFPAPLERLPFRPTNTSWVLRADRLVLRSLGFHGVVTVRTAAGPVRVLKFTARSVTATALDLSTDGGRTVMRLPVGPGATSTLTGPGGNGVVTLYVRKLSGRVTALGDAPLPADRTATVTPDAVPPWLVPRATPTRMITFTDATVSPLAQFGGNLSITGPRLATRPG
ncbi:hypothetical protein [Streptomyces sp. NPDC006012]|uniref:hypothetical protein n=1 Tax=Streptomyces sp. NPDC006012 TaxID=3364739 RepID=UPI0036B4EA3E